MQHYLLIYDRRKGRIIRHRAYHEASSALTARFAAEREYGGDPDIEVVVLGAESWESVAHTHARYFKGVHEMAEAALSRVAEEHDTV